MASGAGTAEAELDIETVLSLAPQADIEVYEKGGASVSLYDVFSQIVNDDTAKIVEHRELDERVRGLCRPVIAGSRRTRSSRPRPPKGSRSFVAAGDQGAQGCNINGEVDAATGSDPVAQAVDSGRDPLHRRQVEQNASVWTARGARPPGELRRCGLSFHRLRSGDRRALDATDSEVFVANSDEHAHRRLHRELQPVDDERLQHLDDDGLGGFLDSPVGARRQWVHPLRGEQQRRRRGVRRAAEAVRGYGDAPIGLRADGCCGRRPNGVMYVADGTNNRIEYFSTAACNGTTISGCSATPSTVSVGNDPVALAVDAAAGDLYVANAGRGRDSVVSLSTHSLVTTIATNSTNQTVASTVTEWCNRSVCRPTAKRSSPSSTA